MTLRHVHGTGVVGPAFGASTARFAKGLTETFPSVPLVHEFQHSKLNALLDLEPLWEYEDTKLYFVPWRRDPRPLSGALQGLYAFTAVASLWRDLRSEAALERQATQCGSRSPGGGDLVIDCRAVVVGVERHAAGEQWDLDGPAMDACRMARWLLSRGLPPEQITLLVEPLPVNAAEVERLGLPTRSPDRATVDALFTDELRTDRSRQLVVFWGGHGVVDGKGNRRLFYADATEHNKRNLDFNSLLSSLASTYYSHLTRQILIVDACQNLTDELRYVNRLPQDTFPQGSFERGREQHVLFAASVGEGATNLTEKKTGLFSAEVLSQLAAEQTWPPDVAAMAEAIDARFTALRSAGQAYQTPTYLWHKTPIREGLIYALPPAPSGRKESLSLDALLELTLNLMSVEEVADYDNRRNMIMFMPSDIRIAVPHSREAQQHVVLWIRACERFSTGRAAFVGALRLGISNKEELSRVLAVVDRIWPSDPS